MLDGTEEMSKFAVIGGLVMVKMPASIVKLYYTPPPVFRDQEMDATALIVGSVTTALRDADAVPDISVSRQEMVKATAAFDDKGPELARIQDITVAGADGDRAARIYSDSNDLSELKPALVYFHGGGFVQGNLETHNESCKKLAGGSGHIVIAVDYRLAPEHPYPAGVDDATAAYLWVVENAQSLGIDADNIGVGGDSAGACHAAVVAQQARNNGQKIPAFQVLIYPVTDGHLNSQSMNQLDNAFMLPKDRMTWYRDLYRADFDDFDDPKFSPLLASDFSNLPKTYILTAGYDPLWDDGKAYGDKLKSDGVEVEHRHYEGQIHAFVNITKIIPQGNEALAEIGQWMKNL